MGMYAPCGLAGCALKGNRRLNSAYPPTARAMLTRAEHTDELRTDGSTHVRVDYRVSGLGSNSCGPELPEKFRVQEKSIAFAFHLHPLKDKGSPGGMEGV